MNRRRALVPLAAALLASRAAAHLNSPNVYLDEAIGPWPAVTTIELPQVIPGEARVVVRLTRASGGEAVGVRLLAIPPEGERVAAPSVAATALSSDPGTFLAPMPLTRPGVWTARVSVSGSRGAGQIDVPVGAKAPPSRRMPGSLIVLLSALMALLLATAVPIARALARNVYALPNGLPESTARLAPWAAAWCFVAILGVNGFAWWKKDQDVAARNAPAMRAELSTPSGQPVAGRPSAVRIDVVDALGKPIADILADHGKMMHAVVVEIPGMSYFLHVHPRMTRPGRFELAWVPPEPGRYEIFADVLSSMGVADTLTSLLTVAPGESARASSFEDPDDSDASPPALGGSATSGASYDLGGGYAMRLVSPATRPVREHELLDLGFELDGADGRPVDALEPYMGMAGHLLIVRDDFAVFAHVHPMGTVPNRMSMPGSHSAMTPEEHARAMATMRTRIEGARVSFPYGFPSPGRYRLFAQVRYRGAVRTGIFDLEVRPAP